MYSHACAARPFAHILHVAAVLTIAFLPSPASGLEPIAPCPAVAPSSSLTTPMIRAGLDAEAFAAAGVTGAEVSGIVTAVAAAVGTDTKALAQADAAHAAARGKRDALKRKVKSGLASDAEVTALAAAETSLTAAMAARAAALTEIFDAGTAGLAATKTATLAAIQQNRAWNVSIQYMVTSRTEAQWVVLVDAVTNKKIAAQLGEPPLATPTDGTWPTRSGAPRSCTRRRRSSCGG